MRAAQISAAQREEEEANASDSKLPAISVARLTLCPSSLRPADQFCAVIASEQIALHSREPELADLTSGLAESEN
jgi:hypothetical protein